MSSQYTPENFAVIALGTLAVVLVIVLYEWIPVLFQRYFVVKRFRESNDDESDGDQAEYHPALPGSEPLVPTLVPPHPDAVRTSSGIATTIKTRADLLDVIARVMINNQYVFSANEIAKLLTNSAFAAARATILDEIAAIRNPGAAPAHACRTTATPRRRPDPTVLDGIESIDPVDHRTVRCDSYGRRYKVGENGQRQYMEEA